MLRPACLLRRVWCSLRCMGAEENWTLCATCTQHWVAKGCMSLLWAECNGAVLSPTFNDSDGLLWGLQHRRSGRDCRSLAAGDGARRCRGRGTLADIKEGQSGPQQAQVDSLSEEEKTLQFEGMESGFNNQLTKRFPPLPTPPHSYQ